MEKTVLRLFGAVRIRLPGEYVRIRESCEFGAAVCRELISFVLFLFQIDHL